MAETMLMLQRSYRKKRLKGFKGSPQELSKYMKSFQRTFGKEKFQFFYLISYLQFNVIHLICYYMFSFKCCHTYCNTSVREYFEATVLSSFLEKVMPVFIFLLIYFTIQHLEYIQDEVRHTVRVQLVPYFCHDTAI